MLPGYFAIIGSVVASLGVVYYLWCTVRGSVQPNRVTWFFWGAFPLIAFFAQHTQAVGVIKWATFVAGAIPFLVLVASYVNPYAYWKVERYDYIFGAIAITGMALWYVTKDANLALTFALLADAAAAIPTAIKTARFPETEDWKAYGITAAGFLVAVLAIEVWTYENYAFVTYLVLVNIVIAVLAVRKPTVVPQDAP